MPDVPSVKDFFWPIMHVMARAGESVARRQYPELVADVMGLTPEQRQVRIPSGKHLTF